MTPEFPTFLYKSQPAIPVAIFLIKCQYITTLYLWIVDTTSCTYVVRTYVRT